MANTKIRIAVDRRRLARFLKSDTGDKERGTEPMVCWIAAEGLTDF